jgi:chromatin structure-remodeling complex subunit RSC1/2
MAGAHSNAPLPSPMSGHAPLATPYGHQFPQARPSPSPAPLTHQNSYGQPGSHTSSSSHPAAMGHAPLYQQQTAYTPQYASGAVPIGQPGSALGNYAHYQNSGAAAPIRTSAPHTPHGSHPNMYNVPRPIEVYTLSEAANLSIPADVRGQFQHDEFGKMLFFTTPPLDKNPLPENKRHLQHSLKYLADKARAKEEEDKKRKARDADLEAQATARIKRMKEDSEGHKKWLAEQKVAAMWKWVDVMEKGTDDLYKKMHGDDWERMRELDRCNLAAKQEEAHKASQQAKEYFAARAKDKEVPITGFSWI